MQLKNFQIQAINELKTSFYNLWQSGNTRVSLTFKSPTGSGKTIMVADFLRRIGGEASFDPDKCFVWISKGELANQSKQKLEQYYSSGLPWTHCLSIDDLNNNKLKKNEIFFVNWEKVISKSKTNRKLRTSGEANTSFDEFIENTHLDNREIVLIIDESHLNLTTQLAKEIIDIINPRISINISATPKTIPDIESINQNLAGFVSVEQQDVVDEGLIKESIKIMPKEEVEILDNNQDLDKLLIDLALNKQQELKKHYENLNLAINPLILVQLPNDEKLDKATEGQSKLEFCKAYLKDCKVDDTDIAIWLSEKKENLENIVVDNSSIKIVIFKQAIATGWDCPRAQILVSFREMKNPVFKTQVFGRILRMPHAKHYENYELNHSYCYTSYSKQEVSDIINQDGGNLAKPLQAKIKSGIQNIGLSSVFLSRTDYNDLGYSFQKTFVKVANDYFDINGNILTQAQDKLLEKGLDITKITVEKLLILDAEIVVYDDFINNLNNADEENHQISYNDVKKMYDLLLTQEILNQEESSKFGNVARSWKPFKSAMNVWLKQFISSNPPLYAVVCNDLLKRDRSVLKIVIEKALKAYKPIREKEVLEKSRRKKQDMIFSILPEYFYNENYELLEVKKYVLDKCYILKPSEVEKSFIHYLEGQHNIDWWYKNADNGKEGFAIEYIDNKGILRAFYPDFIVRQNNKIGMFDTKGGFTVDDATQKAEALYGYCQNNKGINIIGILSQDIKEKLTGGHLELWGGIVQLAHNGVWKIYNDENYSANIDEWENLNFV